MYDDGSQPPPCSYNPEAWFLDNAWGAGREVRPEEDRRNHREAVLRAQLTCLTGCHMRRQCMESALGNTDYDQHHIWGGYQGAERQNVLDNGPLPVTREAMAPPYNIDRTYGKVTEFIDYHLTLSEAAERWGFSVRYTENILKYAVWQLRVLEGDPWVMLHDSDVSSTTETATATEVAATVRAA